VTAPWGIEFNENVLVGFDSFFEVFISKNKDTFIYFWSSRLDGITEKSNDEQSC
jgi:hypothetical protein